MADDGEGVAASPRIVRPPAARALGRDTAIPSRRCDPAWRLSRFDWRQTYKL